MAEKDVMVSPDLAGMRTDYRQRSLSERDVDPDPFRQFSTWFSEAVAAQAREPNAMTLATCTPDGIPSARVVLLKGVDRGRFVFFTNYSSRKGRELDANPRAALVFYWSELERQVRIEGTITRTSGAESDAYFRTRPAASRIGAVVSAQSQPVESREVLEARFAELTARYASGDIPRPADWGGYELHPTRLEFWQGRPSRLHDRIEYLLERSGHWGVRRLSP